LILVDTSAWIDFFRGRGRLADAVDRLIETDDAAVCGPIVTEVRRGLRSPLDRRRILPLFESCHRLDDPARLWEEAGDLGYFLTRKGLTVKTLDLLIASYALSHSVALLTADGDFDAMRRAGLDIQLLPN
jgi:hypothetical protein